MIAVRIHISEELDEVVNDLGGHGATSQLPTSRIFSCAASGVMLASAEGKEHAGVDKWVAGGAKVSDVVAEGLVLTELSALC